MNERTDGDCFVVAGEIVAQFGMPFLGMAGGAKAGIDVLKAMGVAETSLVLVHGWVTRHTDGRRHEHGWVELAAHGLVADFANGRHNILPASLYYKAGCIHEDETTTYTPSQAKQMMVEYATYGPWPNEEKEDE